MKNNILPEIISIINSFREYWPLTLRQIYYQLVAKELILNNKNEYKSLSRMLTTARENNKISWDCMHDRTRIFFEKPVEMDANNFIKWQSKAFLNEHSYFRDLMQEQLKYIEIWIEKDALYSLFEKVCIKHCIPLVVCKGYPSTTFKNNYINRSKCDKDNLILYFGDMDASGLNIFDTTKEYFGNKLNNFKMDRIALNKEQISKYKLPASPDAIKVNDSRTSL
jgi:hypothetical protein